MVLKVESFVINHRIRRDITRNVCAVTKLMCSE